MRFGINFSKYKNIIIDAKKVGINTRNEVNSTQDRNYWRTLVNSVLILRVL